MGVEGVLVELSIIIMVTLFLGGLLKLFKQPLIIAYIITGVLLGPYALNVVQSTDAIATFSTLGVALLLFVVGLHLNPRLIREIGKVAILTGLGQIVATAIFGFILSSLLGFSLIVSLYLAIGITFSSTIIILKLLSDKGELGSLHGKICIGYLIVQDIAAVFILIFIASRSKGLTGIELAQSIIVNGGFLIIVLTFIAVYLFPRITKSIVRSQEYLLLFAVGWCLAISSLFYHFGFSFEVGALLAGIALSMSPYHHDIALKMKPLRDFFIVLFFIMLGSQMVFTSLASYIWQAIIFAVFVLICQPLIMMIIMGAMGYTRRTSFEVSMTVPQVSEFSIIIATLGVAAGDLSPEILSFVTLVSLMTIAGSTYLVMNTSKLYHFARPYLGIFERKKLRLDKKTLSEDDYDIVLFGCNRIGFTLLESFSKLKKKFLIIDHNPDVVENLKDSGYQVWYSDASNPELMSGINLTKVKMVVSTVPDIDVNVVIINKLKLQNPDTIIIVVSHEIDEALALYDAGASYVIMPHFLGGHTTSVMIEEHGLNLDKFLKHKVEHIEHLTKRKKAGHAHPLNT